ncbi:MAG: hypothetical protein AAGH15_14760 [Myxococcota bacterium]
MTQKADGRFEPSDALRALLGPERSARLEAALRGADAALVATELVLVFLAAHEDRRRVEWQPAGAKAERWLASQPARYDARPLL